MAYLKPIETDTVTLPSDSAFYVKLKRRATYGDQLAAQSAMLKIEGQSGTVTQMEWGAYIQALTAAMIVEWNLTDELERPLAVTQANLALLSPEDGQYLATQVSERAKTRAVEQERPFESPPSAP